MALEVIYGDCVYGFKSDVCSFGMTMSTVLSDSTLNAGSSRSKVNEAIARGYRPPMSEHISDEFWRLIHLLGSRPGLQLQNSMNSYVPMVICGNHVHENEDKAAILRTEGEALAQKYGDLFLETHADDCHTIDNAFLAVAKETQQEHRTNKNLQNSDSRLRMSIVSAKVCTGIA